MSLEDSFLQAIIEKPEDDTPRLIYADWLEERGDPRGEFIRIQCRLARLPEGDPREAELNTKAIALLKENKGAWAGPLRDRASLTEFRRGFVEVITTSPEDFLAHADDWFKVTPIRNVKFQTGRFQLGQPNLVFTSSAHLLPQLAASPHLARLSALSFWQNYIGDQGLEALAASPYLGQLSSLDLTSNDVGDAGITALASSSTFSRLTSLTLAYNHVGQNGAQALAGSQHLSQLVHLDLSNNPIGDEGVGALASSRNFCRLETLGLARSGLGSAGARALAASPHLSRLNSLDVRDNRIGNKPRQGLRLRFGKGHCHF